MSNLSLLKRRIQREIKAREEAERISEKKISELYKANRCLEVLLATQKEISATLSERTHDLALQKIETEYERHAKSTLQNILESSIEYSIISINLEGLILVWNEGAKRIYGYSAEEVVNKRNIEILYKPEDIEQGLVKQFYNQAYNEGKAEAIFERVRKDNSRLTASVSISLRRDDLGNPIGYALISKDITTWQAMQEQLIKSNEELENFAYITSHDLKAPLRAIERLSTWLEEDNRDKLDEKSKKNLVLLRQRVNRMTSLIEGILQYSRAGRTDLDVHVVDTKTLLHDVIDSLHPPTTFTISCADDLPVFQTASIPLSQVFANLINNAIKHHHLAKGTIHISVKESALFYEFLVSDDGPGIEPCYFEQIFQLFQTLQSRDELESTGIGLTIVKKIVESQGGEIHVESTVGVGTCFRFTWPKSPRS